jgi:metallo-beta-lactamase family protein
VGRALADGVKEVKIAGQKIKVQAKTHLFGGLSGHAGQSDLLNWFGSLAASRPRVILTHGEDMQRKALGDRIQERFGLSAEMPAYRDVIEFS